MYEKPAKQERLTEAKVCSIAFSRTGLKDDIEFENKRVNVDSAKKIAVMQHMDYDNFHQMVLGANIKPMKAGQLTTISADKKGMEEEEYFGGKPKPTKGVLDSLLMKSESRDEQKVSEVMAKLKEEKKSESSALEPTTAAQFQKIFKYDLPSDDQRAKFLLGLKARTIKKVFKKQFNSQLANQIFGVMLKFLPGHQSKMQLLLKAMASLDSFEDAAMFFTPEDKEVMKELANKIEEVTGESEKLRAFRQAL